MEEPLFKVYTRLTLDLGKARGDLRKFVALFDCADEADWERLSELLGDSGHGKFWKATLWELRLLLKRVNDDLAPKERPVNELETKHD